MLNYPNHIKNTYRYILYFILCKKNNISNIGEIHTNCIDMSTDYYISIKNIIVNEKILNECGLEFTQVKHKFISKLDHHLFSYKIPIGVPIERLLEETTIDLLVKSFPHIGEYLFNITLESLKYVYM